MRPPTRDPWTPALVLALLAAAVAAGAAIRGRP